MTDRDELVSILFSLTPEEIEEFCSDITTFYSDNMPRAMQNTIALLRMLVDGRQVPPPQTHLRRLAYDCPRALSAAIRRKQAGGSFSYRRTASNPVTAIISGAAPHQGLRRLLLIL